MVRPNVRSVISVLALASLSVASLAQPADDETSYRAATGLLQRDLPEQAIPEYRTFLREHPASAKAANARYALAVCLTRVGKWREAGMELDQLGENRDFEFAPDALLLRAQCDLNLKQPAEAVERLQKLLEDFPKYERADAAAGLLGETLYRQSRPADARQVLQRFARAWPESLSRPRAEVFLALVDIAEHHDREAADRLALARQRFPKAEVVPWAGLIEGQCRHRLAIATAEPDKTEGAKATTLYRTAAEVPELAPDALLGLGQLTRAMGDPRGAGMILDEFLKRFATSPLAVAGRIERARAYLDEGEAPPALALLDGQKDSAESAFWAAKAEMKLAKFEAAANRLGHAADVYPQSPILPEILFDRAVALAGAGKQQEARAAYATMRQRYPDHALAPEAMAAEASLALSLGDAKAASELSRQFLASHASHERAATVELVLAQADASSGSDQAASEFEAYLKKHPGDARAKDVAIRRGLVLARQGNLDAANESLAGAMKSDGAVDPALVHAAAVLLADAAMAKSDWADAEAWLTKAEASPECKTPDSLLKLGICNARLGRAEQALSRFDAVVSDYPKDPAALQAKFERAQIRVEQGKLDAAATDFEDVLATEQSVENRRFSVHCLRNLAAIASKQGRARDAESYLSKVAASPDAGSLAADALYERATTVLAQGRYEEAVGAFDQFLRGAESHPRSADAKAQRAIALSRLGKYEDALKGLDEAEADSSKLRPEVLAAARYERAWDLRALNRNDEAREAYAKLLTSRLSPELQAHASLDLAQLEAAAGDHAKALDYLAQAQKATESADGKLDAVAARALYLRAVSLLKLDKPAEALAATEELLRRFDKSDIAMAAELLAGQAALKAGKAEAAADHLQRVVDSNPTEEVLGAALLSLGDALAATHQWPRSQAAFEQYLAKAPKSELWFQAQFGIGWALENQGRHAEAVSAYREVVNRHNGPTAARAQFQIGECLFAQKQYDDATRELMKVDILYAYPEWSAAALYEAGRCFAQLNKPAEAQAQFKQVTDRFKDTQWARLAAQQAATTKSEPLPGRAAPDTR